jgi:hypothetical protein
MKAKTPLLTDLFTRGFKTISTEQRQDSDAKSFRMLNKRTKSFGANTFYELIFTRIISHTCRV